MLYPPGFYYVKKSKRFVILSSDKSSERNLSCFFDILKPRRIEHLQNQEPFSSDLYFSKYVVRTKDILFGSYDRAIMWPKETKPNWYIEISDNLKPFFLDGDAQCNGAKDESMGSESVSEIADFFLS